METKCRREQEAAKEERGLLISEIIKNVGALIRGRSLRGRDRGGRGFGARLGRGRAASGLPGTVVISKALTSTTSAMLLFAVGLGLGGARGTAVSSSRFEVSRGLFGLPIAIIAGLRGVSGRF